MYEFRLPKYNIISGIKQGKLQLYWGYFGLFLHFDLGPWGPNVYSRVPNDQQDQLLGRGGHQG